MEKTVTEAVEACPFCVEENIFPNWDIKTQGFKVTCRECGEEMMLCDECLHAEDNKGGHCDWHEIQYQNYTEGHCFRGVTKHKKYNA